MSIAHNLIQVRKQQGLTQLELSKATGVDQGMISHYEAGKRMPRLETLKTLCEALDCTASELLGW